MSDGILELAGLQTATFQTIHPSFITSLCFCYTMVRNTKSGPGTCTKCSKHLMDLLDHINKRHKDDRFRQEELTDSGLMACFCGKVVLNNRGLLNHQVRSSCQASQATHTGRSMSSQPQTHSLRSHPYRSPTLSLPRQPSSSPFTSLSPTPASSHTGRQSTQSTIYHNHTTPSPLPNLNTL